MTTPNNEFEGTNMSKEEYEKLKSQQDYEKYQSILKQCTSNSIKFFPKQMQRFREQ